MPSVAPSGVHKPSTSYAHSLYLLGIQDSRTTGIIPLVSDHNEVCNLGTEVSKLVSVPNDLTSLLTFMNNWFQEFKPNDASWVNFCASICFNQNRPLLVKLKLPCFANSPVHSSPMTYTNWRRGNYVKRDSFRPASKTFKTPAEIDIRSRSDFVFAASTKFYFPDNVRTISEDHSLSGISDNLCSCAVAIAAEVKATSSPRSFTAAKSQYQFVVRQPMLTTIISASTVIVFAAWALGFGR